MTVDGLDAERVVCLAEMGNDFTTKAEFLTWRIGQWLRARGYTKLDRPGDLAEVVMKAEADWSAEQRKLWLIPTMPAEQIERYAKIVASMPERAHIVIGSHDGETVTFDHMDDPPVTFGDANLTALRSRVLALLGIEP